MPTLLILERDSAKKDRWLISSMKRTLGPHFNKIVCYELHKDSTSALLDPNKKLVRLPFWIRKPLKALILLGYPSRWSYYFPPLRKEESIEKRCWKLKSLVKKLKKKDGEIIIVSRSAGGRISSLVADELGIEKLVCLGYPFKHPHLPDEPERYLHLEKIQTPFLIIQGNEDEYGGLEVAQKYHLSPSIDLNFVNTDHEFKLQDTEWNAMIERIKKFIA